MQGFITVGGINIRPSQIEPYQTQYHNGGQSIVTYIKTLSGDEISYEGTRRDLEKLMEESNEN